VTKKKALSVREAAEALGVSERLVRTAIDDGVLPALRLGRRILIPMDAIDAWLDGRTSGGGPNA
jgi:excisionase family DNA binding protein